MHSPCPHNFRGGVQDLPCYHARGLQSGNTLLLPWSIMLQRLSKVKMHPENCCQQGKRMQSWMVHEYHSSAG